MARPLHSRRAPSTTILFRVTIQRPRRRFGRARYQLRARKGRGHGKSIRFRSSRYALPPFFIFMEKHRRQLQRSNPKMGMVEVAKKLGQMWQRLPEKDKNVYKDMAKRMKGRRRAHRSRSKGPKMSSQRKALSNTMVSFTTKAASLRKFLMSYL